MFVCLDTFYLNAVKVLILNHILTSIDMWYVMVTDNFVHSTWCQSYGANLCSITVCVKLKTLRVYKSFKTLFHSCWVTACYSAVLLLLFCAS